MRDENNKIIAYCMDNYKVIFLLVPLFFILLALKGFNLNENAYFYTLSSIAQTLAAIIGIIGAFTIFQMNQLESDKNDLIRNLANRINHYPRSDSHGHNLVKEKIVKQLFDFSGGKDLLINTETFLKDFDTYNLKKGLEEAVFQRYLDEIKSLDNEKNNLLLFFSTPLKYGILSIVLSIFLLPLGKMVYPSQTIELFFPFTYAYDFDFLQKMKLAFVGMIVYFSFISIVASAIFLGNSLKIERK